MIDQADDDILDEDDCHAETNRETPSPSLETELDGHVSKSTKEPIKIKPSRKKQAEEEYKLIKGLAESIAERKSKKPKVDTKLSSTAETFGRYIAHTLTELDTHVQHMVKHRINNILFQAQTGELVQNPNIGISAPITQQHFQSWLLQYNVPVNNQSTAFTASLNEQQCKSSLQNDNTGFLFTPHASTSAWVPSTTQ